MGTSSSGSGPGNNSSLLPNWDSPGGFPDKTPADSPPDNDNDQNDKDSDNGKEPDNGKAPEKGEKAEIKKPEKPPITGNWGSVKATLGKIANGSKSYSFKGMGKSYVSNLGGVKNAVKGSRTGINGGSSYGSFLGSVGLNGFTETLRIFGLSDCIGKSAEEVFTRISDKICPTGNTNDEAITRKALLDSLGSLYEKFVENGNITIDNLQEKDLLVALTEYAGYYIYHKWLYELGLAIENKRISEADAIGLEEEMKEFIFGEVRVELKGKNIMEIDFNSGEGKEIIENIFEQSYTTLIS